MSTADTIRKAIDEARSDFALCLSWLEENPHEMVSHMADLAQKQNCVNALVSALSMVDPSPEAATPADTTPRYGYVNGQQLVAPQGYELIDEGSYVIGHYAYYYHDGGWCFDCVSPHDAFKAQLTTTTYAYARKVAP